jgi:hypothetical protein
MGMGSTARRTMKLGHGVVLNKIRSGRRSQNVTPVARSHSWGLDFQNWIRLALVSSVLGSSRSSDDKTEKPSLPHL